MATSRARKKKAARYEPTPDQREVHLCPSRFRIVAAGRRFGKTTLSANEILWAAREHGDSLNFWVAPVYAQARIGYNLLKRYLDPETLLKARESQMRIDLLNGSVICCRSADRPDTLRGYGLDFLVGDEFDSWKPETWTEVLRPTLSDTLGRALLIGTPGRKSLLYELYLRGQDPAFPDYRSFHFRTADNPLILPAEIEEAKRAMPEDVFRREYLAEFGISERAVFRNVRACIVEEPLSPNACPDRCVAGLDLAKNKDWTVALALRSSDGLVVGFDRFTRLEYRLQVRRIREFSERFGRPIFFTDQTGVGEAVAEQLREMGVRLEGVRFTSEIKRNLVENLQLRLEQSEIRFPLIAPLVAELEAFEYGLSPTGQTTYNAPPGQHDDCVMALALAAQGWKTQRRRPKPGATFF